jgi:peptidyl-prolyl cis-trans isomerase C
MMLFCWALGLVACQRDAGAPPAQKVGVAKDVVASVNGVPVTRFEVMLRTRSTSPQGLSSGRDAHRAALDAIITDELYAQEAKAAGLERDPAFLEEMARVEAGVAEVRRQELAKLFLHREIIEKATVSSAEARAFFDQHPERFRVEWVVEQIVVKSRGDLDAVTAALAQGQDFDQVAAKRLPGVPAGEKPWVLAPMRWEQVPSAWWPALEKLEVGEVSAPIAMPRDRWVVLELLERRAVEAPDFAQVEPFIQAQLKADRIETVRAKTEAALRRAATVLELAEADAGL